MKLYSIPAVALLVIGLAGAADSPTPKTAAQAEQEALPVGSRVQTSGKVTSVHSAEMVGNPDPHMIVKLQDEQGDIDIVDLGSTSQLKDNGIEPKEGQQFWVDGRVGKINDKFLIVAERLSESRLITIARNSPLKEETVKHAEANKDGRAAADVNATAARASTDGKDPSAPKTETIDAGHKVRTIEGTVVHTRHIRIEGEAEEHVLAKVKTDNGVAVLDLGTCPMMPNNVNLAEGQTIFATGFVGQLNGKPVILADSVGNLSPIQRSEAIPTSSTPPAKQ